MGATTDAKKTGTLHMSVPSKTFLLGEYSILNGGRALLINNEPRFSCSLVPTEDSKGAQGFSQLGAAARLLQDIDLSGYSLHFQDPHEGQGGFGASGAQYIFAYAVKLFLAQGLQAVENLRY